MTTGGYWWQGVSRRDSRVLAAAMSGWMLDAADVMLLTFALNSIRAEFGRSGEAAGGIAAVSLAASARRRKNSATTWVGQPARWLRSPL